MRVYNSIANASKGVLFVPPSDVYIRGFLYLCYTLIKLYYTKLRVIKPCLWSQIEFFSSGGQESQCLSVVQQQPYTSKVMLKILNARLQQYVNFQMFKLVLKKVEEPEIKLPTSAGSSKKQQSSRKTYALLY